MSDRAVFKLSAEDRQYFRDLAENVTPKSEALVRKEGAEQIARIETRLEEDASYIPSFVRYLLNDIRALHGMLCDDTFELRAGTRNSIVFALGYLFEGDDAIPDDIPIVGYLDDIVVLGWTLTELQRDMGLYRKHQQRAEKAARAATRETDQ